MFCVERAQAEVAVWVLYGLLIGGMWWSILTHRRALRGEGWLPEPRPSPSLDALVKQARDESERESEGARLLAPLCVARGREVERARMRHLELRAQLDELSAPRGRIVSEMNGIREQIEVYEAREKARAADERKGTDDGKDTPQCLPRAQTPPARPRAPLHGLSPADAVPAGVARVADPGGDPARVQDSHSAAPPQPAQGCGEPLRAALSEPGSARALAGPPRVLVGSAPAPSEGPREVRRRRLFGPRRPVDGGGRSGEDGAPGLTPDSIATAPNGRRAIEAGDVRAALASGIRGRAK